MLSRVLRPFAFWGRKEDDQMFNLNEREMANRRGKGGRKKHGGKKR